MQFHKPVAAILSVVFIVPVKAETVSTRELALGIPIGSTVAVRLIGKQRPHKLRGQIGQLDNQAFDLTVANSGGQSRSIPFDQVKSLKVLKTVRAEPVEHNFTPTTAQTIPKGALVEVRFVAKQQPNWLRGRMGQVGSQDFQVQVFRSGIIDTQTIRLGEVQSIKPVDTLWVESTPAKVHRAIGTGVSIALTTALILVVVGVVILVTHGD